jgi:hypothetical protein
MEARIKKSNTRESRIWIRDAVCFLKLTVHFILKKDGYSTIS